MAFRIVKPVTGTTRQSAAAVAAGGHVPDSGAAPGTRHAQTAPIYAGSVRVVNYGMGARTGRTAVLQLVDPPDPHVHPFKGLRWSRSRSAGGDARGHRLHLVISQPPDDDWGEDTDLYIGEGMLNWLSDDCANGMRVTLRFDGGPDGADWHPLTGLEADQKGGDIAYLACWAVADDEAVQDPREARRASRPFSTLTAVQQSQIKCRTDERFQAWCAEAAASLLPPRTAAGLPCADDGSMALAEAVVRAYCGVTSRSTFSQDTAQGFAARQRWQEMLRLYGLWRRAHDAGGGHPERATPNS
jgi:hypothetical protein